MGNINNLNNGGRWQLAFWIMTGVCFAGMVFAGTSIVTNDRLSRTRDERITINMNTQYADIVQRLARIETKLEK